MQTKIPCMLMRGGTSKGPYFLQSDLPASIPLRDSVLISVMGSPHIRQIDGIGGAEHLTSKVAIIGPSKQPGIDVEYLFAQVEIDEPLVDTSPNCGNIMSGVGPFAIERGIVKSQSPETKISIFNINTQSSVEAVVQTPGAIVEYDGDTAIAGVNGVAAPVSLKFLDIVGSKNDAIIFPTGKAREEINGIPVTLMDVGHPMVFIPASAVGKTGYESKQELDSDLTLLQQLEELRLEAGRRMGLGDVAKLHIPLPTLVAAPRAGGTICARNFLPKVLHSAYGVTQTLCTAAACIRDDTIVSDYVRLGAVTGFIEIEHVSGSIVARVEISSTSRGPVPLSITVTRTCRKLFDGYVYIPGHIWDGKTDRAIY